MPRGSIRRHLLYDIQECMKYAIFFQTVFDSSSDDEYSDDELDSDNEDSVADGSTSESSDSSSDDEFEDVLNVIHGTYVTLLVSRYTKARVNIPRSREFIFEYFKDLTPEDFQYMTQISRDTFDYVLELISDDPIFQNCSLCPQAPIHWQLACMLDRLGNDGQGVGAAHSKFIWGLGYGTVFDHYRRVVHAICNLRNRFLRWPDARERQQFSLQMESRGFKGAVAFVDGTTFPLHVKPTYHGNDYHDRKKRYSINAQVVCDPNHKIRHFLSGMPGSCHDARIFSHSPLVSNPESYFSPRQYILADSTYTASEFVVPTYRSRSRDNLADDTEPAQIEAFNTYLAKARIVNEHTIGILKSRWTSLRCLRLRLREHGDIVHLIKHTICCAILHNIALDKDPWEEELTILDREADVDDEVETQAGAIGGQTPGQRKRLEGNTRAEKKLKMVKQRKVEIESAVELNPNSFVSGMEEVMKELDCLEGICLDILEQCKTMGTEGTEGVVPAEVKDYMEMIIGKCLPLADGQEELRKVDCQPMDGKQQIHVEEQDVDDMHLK